MTKLIAAFIILVALFGGWQLFFYWEKIKNEEEVQKKQAASSVVTEDQLSGLPRQFEPTLKAAEAQGAVGLRNWLKTYGKSVQDPRKAWIELDYCLLISRDDPSEAKRVFAKVKNRTPESSPIWPRIKKLEKAYE
jgi:hypothetical protein